MAPESISNLSSQNAELGSSKSDQSPGAIDRPRFWDNDHFNSPAQAVIGISHFEAQAYCAWISSQSGLKVRLPSLPEWRRIASGPDTWPFPWGPASRRRACNSIENRLRRPSPAWHLPGQRYSAGYSRSIRQCVRMDEYAGRSECESSSECRGVFEWSRRSVS